MKLMEIMSIMSLKHGFKAFGRALKEAVRIDEKNKDKVISSKGVL